MNFGLNGLWGLIVLVADVWAIINVAQSSASNEKKALWIVLVVILPVVGFILWYFLGPRGGKA
jgi:succinate dehydrogenase/fumarate reductase cytochrome b subunit